MASAGSSPLLSVTEDAAPLPAGPDEAHACCASCELGAVDLYDAQGCLLERIALVGDHHSLAIDLAHLVPRMLACPCRLVILHHSHPSGRVAPSEADIAATRAFAGLLRLLGMRLHDHVIEGGRSRFSFRAEGLI